MKQYTVLCLIVAIILFISPFIALISSQPEKEQAPENETNENISVTHRETANNSEDDENTITVFMTESSEIMKMEMKDYIIGVVAAEVPASYETEAIKAQAIVAMTYAQYRKKHPDKSISADISDDSSKHQGYMSDDDMKEKWGDAYESYRTKIEDAVDSVTGSVILYENEPIMAAYHAISGGKTESAENIWGEDIPYLQSVDSEWDIYSSRYTSELRLTADEVKKIMKTSEKADFDSPEEEWIEIKKTTDNGTVLEAMICGIALTGIETRELFALRSPVFDVQYEDGEFIFTVSGYGHGVGMSQNGANCMAKEGKTAEEIIKHYYKGVTIERN